MNRIGSEFWVALRDTLQEFRRRQHALSMYARRCQMCCQKNDEPPLIKENYGIVEAKWKSIKGGRETIGYVLFDLFKQ